MKKALFILGLTFFTITGIKAQGIDFGVTGGLLNTNADLKISLLGFDIANIDAANQTGFYIGLLADIEATERFHVQPELTYGSAGDLSFFYLPIMAKFYVTDGFSIQAGPQFSFSSEINEYKRIFRDAREAILAVDGPDIGDINDLAKTTAVELGFGAGYDISENFMIQARYAFSITDRYSGPLGGSLDLKNATLNVGVAYMF